MKLSIEAYFPHIEINQLEVWVASETKQQRVNIKLHSFEMWLEKDDRLEWISDTVDGRGDHKQQTGKYSLDQYWELPTGFIERDIMDYIRTSPLLDEQGEILAEDAIAFLIMRLTKKQRVKV